MQHSAPTTQHRRTDLTYPPGRPWWSLARPERSSVDRVTAVRVDVHAATPARRVPATRRSPGPSPFRPVVGGWLASSLGLVGSGGITR
jgi:hypothetical protein